MIGERELNHHVVFPVPPKAKLQTNYISTTKYNIITFLPLALIIQFKRYANIYFLISAVMQSIPLISPLSPFSAVAPLIFVISLSMIREGYEDYQRYKSDKESNSRKTMMLVGEEFQQVEWSNVKPGNFVKVQQDQAFPSDVIAFVSSLPTGIVYLETSSLDGQKNLKPKSSLTETQLLYNSEKNLSKMLNGELDCIVPNGQLYQFDGEIKVGQKGSITMNQKNLLLRGSKLRNVDWIIGLVVYTGQDTKIMRNGAKPFTKISKIESIVNNLILAILVFQLLCCVGSAVYCYFQCLDFLGFQQTILLNTMTCEQLAFISFGSYFILNNTMIPISLIVSLEFVKVFQGYFMQNDQDMYSPVNDKHMKCNSVSINEELGQVQYILTDKTGTLTCNQMVFKQMVVGDQTYGSYEDPHLRFRSQSVSILRKSDLKAPRPSEVFEIRGISHDLHRKTLKVEKPHNLEEILEDRTRMLQEMLLIMSTCHECIRDPRNNEYQGPSPDEVTLVNAACSMGYEFIGIENNTIIVKVGQRTERLQFVHSIEFNSDRKRMSVVVRHNGLLKLFIKGADSTIVPRLAKHQPYLPYINRKAEEMSRNGLRSLMFAVKILEQSVLGRMPLDDSIENELTLIGLTGIEDKLQDYVPETIASLRYGGIKFVLLTGDKVETAENISRSCGLIEDSISLTTNESYKVMETLKILQKNPGLSLVIDGSIVDIEKHKDVLSHIIIACQSTVFCRVTPYQKAQVVKLVKNKGKMTLAVGDGANDVNMILQAHVGVGLFGQEGMRAAQVSNYAIGQFCLLWKLLLYHGRLNYIRVSEMILYFFYKNMVFTMPQVIYSFYNIGSGQSIYQSWAITLYNLAFTFFPVVITAVFQTDLSVEAQKNKLKRQQRDDIHVFYPKMYYIGQKNTIFTRLNFLGWFVLGAVQGIICLFITMYSLGGSDCNSGQNSYVVGYYFVSISLVTSIVIIVNVKLALNVQNWNCLLLLGFIIPTLGGYILYLVASDLWPYSETEGYTADLLTMPTFYLTQILTIFGIFALDLFIFSMKNIKLSLQNYIKHNTLKGHRLSENKITLLDSQLRSKQPKQKQPVFTNLDQLAFEYASQKMSMESRKSIRMVRESSRIDSLQISLNNKDEL